MWLAAVGGGDCPGREQLEDEPLLHVVACYNESRVGWRVNSCQRSRDQWAIIRMGEIPVAQSRPEATGMSPFRSWARCTTPMPPWPRMLSIRYCLSVRARSGCGGVSCGAVGSMPANDAKRLKNLSAVGSILKGTRSLRD